MRCPVCKAENADAPQCRRCKADLSLLVALEQRRAQALTSAAARSRAATLKRRCGRPFSRTGSDVMTSRRDSSPWRTC